MAPIPPSPEKNKEAPNPVDLAQGLQNLKQQLPEAKVDLLLAKEKVVEGAREAMDYLRLYNPFNHDILDPEKAKDKIKAGEALVFLMWFLKPEKEDKNPQKALADAEAEKQTMDNNYAEYKKTGDPNKIRDYFKKATARHESGNWENRPEMRLRLANMHAIVYEMQRKNPDTGEDEIYTNSIGKQLKELGIEPPKEFIVKGSESLFGNKEVMKDFATFSDYVGKTLQPNIKDPKKRLENATEIVARCAIGKYQIIPYFHFEKMGWATRGEVGLKKIYEFLQSESMQEQVVDKITDDLGERYKWDPLHMAAAFYGGYGAGDKLRDAPKSGSLEKTQPFGYESVSKYAKGIASAVYGWIKSDKSS